MIETTKTRTVGYEKAHDLAHKTGFYPFDLKVYTEEYVSFRELKAEESEFRLVFETNFSRVAINFDKTELESLAASMIKFKVDKKSFPEASETSPETYSSNELWISGKVSITPTWDNNHEEYCVGNLIIRLQSDDADWSDTIINMSELKCQPDDLINEIGVALMKTAK